MELHGLMVLLICLCFIHISFWFSHWKIKCTALWNRFFKWRINIRINLFDGSPISELVHVFEKGRILFLHTTKVVCDTHSALKRLSVTRHYRFLFWKRFFSRGFRFQEHIFCRGVVACFYYKQKNGPGERSLRCDVCARSFLTTKVDRLRRLSTICACVKEAIRSFQALILAADPIYRRKVKYAKIYNLLCEKHIS